MTIRDTIREIIVQAITSAQKTGTLPAGSLPEIRVDNADDPAHGDYATPVALALGKMFKKNPRDVATAIVDEIKKSKNQKIIDRVEMAGPGFINFWLTDAWLEKQIAEIVRAKKTALLSREGKGKTVVVELSSVNIAKEMNIGHFRSNIIGDALANFYEALGYKVIRDNHLGDWGTQFGKLIVKAKQQKDLRAIVADPSGTMKIYVDFHREAEKNPELEDLARRETKKLQEGDPENRKIWKMFVDKSLLEFKKVYDRLGTRFDTMHGESFYDDMLEGVVDEAKEKGVAHESQGAIIISFDDLPPAIIQKSDGAFNYATTDLATIKYRAKTYKPFRVLYCVANEQALHFSQVFAAAKKLGYAHTGELVHVKFGMALGADGKKFSTRRGETIRLMDVMDEVVRRTRALLDDTKFSDKEKKAIAEAVGIGALKYNDLSQNRVHDIRFDWDKMLSTTGNSAPYLQYVAVRIQGILRKARDIPKEKGSEKVQGLTSEERALAVLLPRFPEVVADAAHAFEPHRLAEFLCTIAATFHTFYERAPVLSAPPALRKKRLAIITAVHQVIMSGLALLGISVPKKM